MRAPNVHLQLPVTAFAAALLLVGTSCNDLLGIDPPTLRPDPAAGGALGNAGAADGSEGSGGQVSSGGAAGNAGATDGGSGRDGSLGQAGSAATGGVDGSGGASGTAGSGGGTFGAAGATGFWKCASDCRFFVDTQSCCDGVFAPCTSCSPDSCSALNGQPCSPPGEIRTVRPEQPGSAPASQCSSLKVCMRTNCTCTAS